MDGYFKLFNLNLTLKTKHVANRLCAFSFRRSDNTFNACLGLHPAGNTLKSHACLGMRQGVVKQHGNANPCAYRTALKEWLDV